MRDLPFFRGDIRDLRLKMGWEARISVTSGSRTSCFYRGRMRDWRGKQSGIRDFRAEASENDPFVRIAVYGFNFRLATALFPVRSCQVYPLSLTLRWYQTV